MAGSPFWLTFWPDLAATGIAVVAGIPVGLWLNRQAERAASRARERLLHEAANARRLEERSRTREALIQLEPVVRAQAQWFGVLGAWGNLREYHEGALVEPWTALRGQLVTAHLTDSHLFGDLARHFERCERLDELVRLRASLTIAGPPAQQARVTISESAIKDKLLAIVAAADDPQAMADRMKTEIEHLA